jgi:preprotein translocase subunit SecY
MALISSLSSPSDHFRHCVCAAGARNVPVMYPGRRVGNRMSMPVKGTLPLMVNMAGMIPLIFAQALLSFPAILAGFFLASRYAWIASIANGIYSPVQRQGAGYWIDVLPDGGGVHLLLHRCALRPAELR